MTDYVVLDASFALKLIFPERFSPEARELLREWRDTQKTILVPALLAIEVASNFSKKVADSLLTPEYGRQLLHQFLKEFPHFVQDPTGTLSARAFEIATELRHRNAYDAHYIALAEHAAQSAPCELWTADRHLFETARQANYPVRLLQEWEKP